MSKDYRRPNLAQYVRFICEKHDLNYDYVKAQLTTAYPELRDKTTCANCGANMEIKIHRADIATALLLIKMAEQVRSNLQKGIPFTEANLVHTPTLPTTDAIRHRTTIASYLNFVKQPDDKKKSGHWLITNWGWAALRGEQVKATATEFRGEIIERSEETITLGEMFKVHTDKVERALAARKAVKADYRADVREYDLNTWVEVSGYAEGGTL